MRPDCFIAGFYKCGTTTLYDVFKQHRGIIVSDEKENDFFMDERLYNKGIDWYERTYYGGIKRKPGQTVMEINPHLTGKSGTASRIRKYYPRNTKIMFILRNPVTMFYSHFRFSVQLGIFPWKDTYRSLKYGFSRAFELYLRDNPNAYRYFENIYSRQITEYIKNFGRENIYCVFVEDIKKDRKKFYNNIYEFFDIKADETINYDIHSNITDSMPKHIFILKIYARYKKILYKLPVHWKNKKLFVSIYNLLYKVFDDCVQDDSKMDNATKKRLEKRFTSEKKRIEKITGRKLESIWW